MKSFVIELPDFSPVINKCMIEFEEYQYKCDCFFEWFKPKVPDGILIEVKKVIWFSL